MAAAAAATVRPRAARSLRGVRGEHDLGGGARKGSGQGRGRAPGAAKGFGVQVLFNRATMVLSRNTVQVVEGLRARTININTAIVLVLLILLYVLFYLFFGRVV